VLPSQVSFINVSQRYSVMDGGSCHYLLRHFLDGVLESCLRFHVDIYLEVAFAILARDMGLEPENDI
jgi:hypothetical protein